MDKTLYTNINKHGLVLEAKHIIYATFTVDSQVSLYTLRAQRLEDSLPCLDVKKTSGWKRLERGKTLHSRTNTKSLGQPLILGQLHAVNYGEDKM